jgi:hypothetical protein
MARLVQLQTLRTKAYQRADQELMTDRFPESEVNQYINDGLTELYDMLVSACGYSYYGTSTSFSCAYNTVSYALPSDFYKSYKVVYVPGNGTYQYELDRLSEVDEPLLMSTTTSVYPHFYRVRATSIDILPAPQMTDTIRLEYIPVCPSLVLDTDTFDGVDGFEEYAVCYAARRMAVKDSDMELANLIYQDMNRQMTRIQRMGAERDKGRPQRVQDVRGALNGIWRRRRPWMWGN